MWSLLKWTKYFQRTDLFFLLAKSHIYVSDERNEGHDLCAGWVGRRRMASHSRWSPAPRGTSWGRRLATQCGSTETGRHLSTSTSSSCGSLTHAWRSMFGITLSHFGRNFKDALLFCGHVYLCTVGFVATWSCLPSCRWQRWSRWWSSSEPTQANGWHTNDWPQRWPSWRMGRKGWRVQRGAASVYVLSLQYYLIITLSLVS